MDGAALTRSAAREAVADVSPPRLREVLDEHLSGSSMAPGALALASLRVVAGGDPEADTARERAAGVQLIYEGLRLTRTLVADDPWAGDVQADVPADLDVVAADVLVARGFRLLARTEVADLAVETVREFGRDQTARLEGEETTARGLESSVFELAVVAGATAGGGPAAQSLRRYAVGLGRSRDPPLAGAADALPADLEEELGSLAAAPGPTSDGAPQARSANRND
ncbi:MAG: hypothetical protein ABEJ42_00140 [Halobacteriaceae archaeon]